MPTLIKPVFKFNRIYKAVFTTKKRYIDAWGGRGRGGSYFATDYALYLLTQPHYCRIGFVRQIFGDIRESLFRELVDRIKTNPTLSEHDFKINDHELRIIYKPTGNMIISKGVKSDGSRTAKMKSLAGLTHIIIEEADEIGEDDFLQMDLSLRTTLAQIQVVRVFNPPHKSHHIWRDYILEESEEYPDYYTARAKESSNVLSVFSTFKDNLQNINPSTLETNEMLRLKKPDYYITVILGLISEGMKGRVYSRWKAITNDFFNEIDARSVWGLDFGSASHCAINENKIVRNNMYVREQNYKPLSVKEIGVTLCKLKIGQDMIIADSAEPHNIDLLREGWSKNDLSDEEMEKYPQLLKGFNIYPAIKGPGSVSNGIELVKDTNMFYTEESENVKMEYITYKWALDKNKNPTDEPEDMNNHHMDGIRYVRRAKGVFF